MNPALKLAGFAVVLVAMLGAGAAIGNVAGPIEIGESGEHAAGDHGDAHGDAEPAADLPAGGLLVAQDGYTFVPENRVADAGPFAFTITGRDGHPVTEYEPLHTRELHLIVASRDLAQYVHLHPARDAHGTWTVDLPALPPGAYRAFADFKPHGAKQYTLGVDLTVPGTPVPSSPLVATARDSVDGLDVTLERDHATGDVTLSVGRNGAVVRTEPYLGAAGHLVAIRDGDLAYLHVHPMGDGANGPVRFAVAVPSAGTYAFFFDFKVDGVVRTARFVVEV